MTGQPFNPDDAEQLLTLVIGQQGVAFADPDASIVITPIGVVRSSLSQREDAPNQAFEGAPGAILEVDLKFAPALHRVSRGTELIVVTWLHAADRSVLQTHPMSDQTIPLTGVFAPPLA
jgi:tRNA (Thr-GGU) A37 N-methylase